MSTENGTLKHPMSEKDAMPHTDTGYKREIVWKNVAYLSYFHLSALYGVYLLLFNGTKFATFLFGEKNITKIS